VPDQMRQALIWRALRQRSAIYRRMRGVDLQTNASPFLLRQIGMIPIRSLSAKS